MAKNNVVLIGMPGSGKTTVAKELGKILNKKIIDIDEEIEKEAKLSINNIFDDFGEDYFRELEEKMIDKISRLDNVIISTGGGAVLNKDNMENLKRSGKIIFLNRSLENISKACHKDRPLLKDNEKKLEDIFNYRQEYYKLYADFTVENNSKVTNVTKKIISLLTSNVIGENE